MELVYSQRAFWVYSCDEWRNEETISRFFIKIYLSLYDSKGPKLSVREWDRQTKEADSQTEECYIDLFLTHVVIPYSGPYVFASSTRGSQPGSVGRPLSPCPLWAIPGCSPNLLTARPNNRDALRTCVYTVEHGYKRPWYKRNPNIRDIFSGPQLEPVLPKQNRPKPDIRETRLWDIYSVPTIFLYPAYTVVIRPQFSYVLG